MSAPERVPAGSEPLVRRLQGNARAIAASVRRGIVWQEDKVFLFLAVVIGLLAGMLVVCFRVAIELTDLWLLGSSLEPGWRRLLLVPALGGLVVGYMVYRFFPRTRGSGVNQTKAALYVYDGYIPLSTVAGKFITCTLSIGSGQSLGPEDPSLQIGAGIASALGRGLRLTREKVRLVAPIGAAAGLAAAFNSPITAVLFVIEEVIGRWSAGVLGAVVLSAVSSVAVERWFLGDEPLFRIPTYHLVHPGELLAYAVLGVVGGFASVAFLKLIVHLRPRFREMAGWTQPIQPAAAGLLIGIIGFWFHPVMGAGYEFMDQAMHGQYTWRILLLLGLFKIVATTISFVSGAPGGLFAPTLFMGAMIGASVGSIEKSLFPFLTASVGAYALVGMGTMFAGNLRAPMTSVFMILEVSGNYSIIVPVMISNAIAYFISRKYQPVPIFDVLARMEGTDLPSMEEQREETTLRVEDAMRWAVGQTLRADETIEQALKRTEGSREKHFLVARPNGTWTYVAKDALDRHAAEGNGAARVQDVAWDTTLPWLHPDNPLDIALRQMADWPLLPVVHRADFHRLEGVISLPDVLAAYRQARRK